MFSNKYAATDYNQQNLSSDIEPGRVVVIEDSFPVISETFILDQITALMDRGFNIENWALYYLDQGVCHSKVIDYGLLEKTRYLKLPDAAYMSKPAEWTSEFAQLNGLGDLAAIRAFHVNYGTNFIAFEPLFQALDAYLIVSFYGYDASRYIIENGDHCYDTLFKRADLITTNTIYMMKTLIRIGCPEHKIKVIRCGVEIPADPVQYRIDNTKITLLTVARLVEKKGIEYALRALAVCSVRNKIIYRIIGDGPLNDELRHLATQLGIDDQVEFLGFLPVEKMQEEMRQADIVLLTSVTAANGDQEGLPVTLVAAQAMGLPVISSYHSGIEELVIHGVTGLLSQEREVNQIAFNIQLLANDPDMRRNLGANGRERVIAEFDREKNIDQLARFLMDGVNDKHRRKAPGVECPICGGVYDSFASYGVEPRPNALCPGCQSLERHRLLWLFLKEKTNLFTSPRLKVLDIAPVPFLSERIKRIPFVQYLSIDIHSPFAMRKMDITNLLLPDDYFDCILCYHVLEHVPNDHKAISELYRVMKPGGWGILQVPLKPGLENTIEDLNITDPHERLRLYGNEDHVRYYGLDYKDRLESVGFTVQVDPFVHTLSECLVRRYGLQQDEEIYVSCKPSHGTKSAKADPADTLTEKSRNEMQYWEHQLKCEGTLSNNHYRYFYTEFWRIPKSYYDGKRILDIGCGPRGSLEWADNAAETVGLDPLAAEYVRLNAGKQRMTYVAAPSENIPYPDGYFDVVCSFNSLDHVDDLETTIAEIKRVVKPDGTFLLLVDVNHAPTECEPQTLTWDIVSRFEPEFEIAFRGAWGRLDDGIYDSLSKNVPYDLTRPDNPGILAVRFVRRTVPVTDQHSLAMDCCPATRQPGPAPNFVQSATTHLNIAVKSNAELFISILTPTYNRGKYLADAVASALSQEYGLFEVIVVDDGSTDDTAAIAGSFHDPRLRYILKEHSGAPATRNRCIKEAAGEYVLWLDSDDRLFPDVLKSYANLLVNNPGLDVVYGDLEITDPHFTPLQQLVYPDWHGKNHELLAQLFLKNSIPNPGTLVRRSCYEAIGGYNESFRRAHDYEWWVRLAKTGSFKHVGMKVVQWRWHDSNMSSGSVNFDTSFDRKIVELMLDTFSLRELFPKLNWGQELVQKTESDAWVGVASRFLELNAHTEALNCLTKAFSLFPQAGLEKLIEQLKKVIGQTDQNCINKQGQFIERTDKSLVQADNVLVSVIVPTHNRPDMLKAAIQSILTQTYQDFEIIVVNDAGQDVASVIQTFNSPKISYLSHETNKGLAATRNTGIRAARGKYLAYLDDDDLFYPDHLETLVNFLENNDYKVAYSDANEALQNKVDGKWVVVKRSCTYSLDFDAEALLVNNFTPVLCVMHRRDCLDVTGLFDETLRRHEDWEMWLRMSRHFPFAHIKKITCEFSTRDDGLGMREGALPSFLVTYRSVCAKHRGLAEGNQRVQDAQQREVYSLLYRTYQFLLRKLMAGADAASLTPTGATEVQIQSATFLYDAYNADNSEKRKRLLEQAIEADPENVVAREALTSGLPVADNSCQACESVAQRPAASIVIVTYNSVATLAACIESVARSLLPGDEVVLVDNASRDETVAKIEQLIYGFSAFRIIRNETNAGFSAATNQGILATRNPLVVLLNPDTVVPKFWLNGLSRHLCNDVAAVGPVSNYVAGLQKMELYQKEPLPSQITIDDAAGLFLKWNDGKGVETRLLIGFCMMMRRDALEKIGYLDSELFLGNDDLDVSWRLRLQGYQLMVATDVFVYHAGQVSFSSEPSETTKRLVQQSTDHLYRKLAAHYAPAPVPPPFELWSIDWFNPSAEALEGSESGRKTKMLVNKQLVSIIILTWNQLPFTQTCLESINRNTPEPYQLIMVDNGSTDGTVPWLRDQALADSRITVIENAENLGFAAGCNQGIRAAQGEFLLLLNNDTVVTPGWLAGMNELLDRYPDAGIIGPMTNSASGVQVIKAPDYSDLGELPAWAAAFRENYRYRIIRQRRIVGFCMLFRRELVEKIGLLDESFGSGNFEDDDYCLRAELAGYQNMIAGDVFVHHAGGATFNGNRINFAEAMKKNMILYRNKWNYNRLDETTLRQLISRNAIQEARRLAMRDEIDKAIELLMQNGIRVAPDNPAPYLELAEILIAAGRHNDALQVVPEMPTTTDQAAINEIESICHAARGDDEAALQAANQVQNRSRSLVVLGTLSARREDLAGAEALFRRAIELDPSCGSAWLSLGMLMWSQGKQEAAWQAVKRSVLVDPVNESAVKILRDMAERAERISEAAKVIGEVTQTNPDSITLSRNHAEILTQCCRTIEALDACESFLVNFGADDSLLSLAIDLRKSIGVYDHLAEGGTQSITLCMIVKDEAEKLAACLVSVKPVVHEMIVVDTGSSDRTDGIAAAFGARVYKFDWNGNFSDARNYAINKAGGKWILVVDADEVLAAQDYEAVRRAVREASDKKLAWSVLTRNYTIKVNAQGWTANDGAYPAEEHADGWHPSWKVRLFPNQPDIRFTGEVHEMVENALLMAGYTINKASFVVHHYGGLEERSVVITEKQRRYFEFGMKKLENNPNDVGALAELAVQANEMDCFEEAIRLWDRLLENDPHNVEALFNKGYALIKLQRYQEALSISEKVLALAPDHREAAFNYGTSILYAGKPSKALHKLEPLLNKHPDYPPLLAVMMLLYLLSGRRAKAVSTYSTLKALNYAISDYVRARVEVLIQLGKEDLARKLLNECETIGIMQK